MHDRSSERITVWSPASISNIGPGFDTLGLAISGFGDRVSGRIIADGPPSVAIISTGPIRVPTDPASNTAGVAANFVLTRANARVAIELEIEKGIPLGSGIGGSAASAAAGAFIANELLGRPFSKDDVVDAAIEGEALASGAEHGDNVLPALLGGLVLVSPENPRHYRRLPIADGLVLAIIIPDLQIMTSSARMILPASVEHSDAVHNAADLAFLLTAFGTGDWLAAGKHVMTDRLAEPYRSRLLPCYDHVKQAALSHGAMGVALSGSGPAMFAIAADRNSAEIVMRSMVEASEDKGLGANAAVVGVDHTGTTLLPVAHE